MEKELKKPIELAGDKAVKIVIKKVEVDSDNNKQYICDLIKLDEEDNEVMYYENVAFSEKTLPVKLSKEDLEELRG